MSEYNANEMEELLKIWNNPAVDWSEVAEMGWRLGKILFPGETYELLMESLKVVKRHDKGLRLRLKLNENLNQIPWESVYVSSQGSRRRATVADFQALRPNFSVVRDEAAKLTPSDVKGSLPTKVPILPSPSGGTEAVLKRNLAILRAISSTGNTPDVLRDLLRDAQVIHIAGHGWFKAGEEALVLQDQPGHRQLISAKQLGAELQKSDVRLVVLQACSPDVAASELLNADVPAFIAMSETMRTEDAAVFSEQFYRALLAGLPIDTAVTSGRMALAKGNDPRSWAGPMLYLRSPEGLLLSENTAEPALATARDEFRMDIDKVAKDLEQRAYPASFLDAERENVGVEIVAPTETSGNTVSPRIERPTRIQDDQAKEVVFSQARSLMSFPRKIETDVVNIAESDKRGDASDVESDEPGPSTERAEASAERIPEAQEKLFVSTSFSTRKKPAMPSDRNKPLRADHDYYFWFNLGHAHVSEAADEVIEPLPPLAPETTLEVGLFGFPDEIQITAGADVGKLFLDKNRQVRVVQQPAGTRFRNLPVGLLLFPVRTPSRAGTYRLRCNIYHKQVLLQSHLIEAVVMRSPRHVEAALRARIDYTLSHTLARDDLSHLAQHRLSLMLNDNGDGTHSFRIFGAHGEELLKNDTSFSGQELQDHVVQARRVLRRAAYGSEDVWSNSDTYRYEGQRLDIDRLRADLVAFAIKGYRLFDNLIARLLGNDDQDVLDRLLRRPGRLQIAFKEHVNYLIPAALFYDHSLDTNKPLAEFTLCPEFLQAMRDSAPLEESLCMRGQCPSHPLGSDDDPKTVVCPSGFWGFRHNLGMPLSVVKAPAAPPEITFRSSPAFTVCVSTDPGFRMRPAHEAALRQLRQNLTWNYAATRTDTIRLLRKEPAHVVYFYCHGGLTKDKVPYLQVGRIDEAGITRDNLRTYRIRWKQPRPLVFINGCHTTALEPEQAIDLVSGFIETAYAAGVIGTEITVFEPLASSFAEESMRRFLAGAEVGDAVRFARLNLLKAGNPLGLVYIPFALGSFRLVQQAAENPAAN